MAERERRELQVPADNFEFTADGRLLVSSERLARAIEEAGIERGSAADAEGVSIGVVVSREF